MFCQLKSTHTDPFTSSSLLTSASLGSCFWIWCRGIIPRNGQILSVHASTRLSAPPLWHNLMTWQPQHCCIVNWHIYIACPLIAQVSFQACAYSVTDHAKDGIVQHLVPCLPAQMQKLVSFWGWCASQLECSRLTWSRLMRPCSLWHVWFRSQTLVSYHKLQSEISEPSFYC